MCGYGGFTCGNERLCCTADPAVVSFAVCLRFLPETPVRSRCYASLAGHSHGGNGLRAAPGAQEAEARGDATGGRAVRPRQVGRRGRRSPSAASLLADPLCSSFPAPFGQNIGFDWMRRSIKASDQSL